MKEERVLTLDDYEYGVVVNALNELRNDLIKDERPTDAVDELLLKPLTPRQRNRRKGILMRRDKTTQSDLILYVVFLIPVIWAALLTAPSLSGGLPKFLPISPRQ